MTGTRLLFIHGREQARKNAGTLRNEWLAALTEGCRKIGQPAPSVGDIDFPYYGDLLDGLAGPEAHLRGEGADDELAAWQREFAEDIAKKAGISQVEIQAELIAADPKIAVRGVQNQEWFQAILRAIDRRFGALSQAILRLVTKDVFIYLTVPGVRDAVDETVMEHLKANPSVVVVGHSLGTVVAYSVLSRDSSGVSVPLLVTLGSPLGVRAISKRFRPLRYPEGVADWLNAYDERDVVALRGLDTMSFPVLPPIRNKNDVKNDTDNRHGITGYLKDPAVAAAICEHLA